MSADASSSSSWPVDGHDDPSRENLGSARFPIVAVGASAGGLEALEELLARIGPSGMAVLVLQHASPGQAGVLTDLIARASNLPVFEAQDRQPVSPNHVYVIPPGVEALLQQGVLRLRSSASQPPRQPIDLLFVSVAIEQGPMALGVVLSGAGSDGTMGLKKIKEEGGITFAQDLSTAAHTSMPDSALQSGCVDFCMAPLAIGDELMRIFAHPYVAQRRFRRRFGQEVLSHIFDQLHRTSGVDFSAYKLSTVERRIERRMALVPIERPSDYLKLLEDEPGELRSLYNDLLIGVTHFFRDREPFQALTSTIIPMLMEKRHPDVPIRIWVPGCATGEEAYSILITLLEFIEEHHSGQRVQLFATDIDENALARARQGVYPLSIESTVSPERLQRFFTRVDKGYQVSRTLRDLAVFARHNLGKDPPFSRLDFISCRNVLIYLQPPLQKRVMRVFHYALNPRGVLLLGSAESVGDASDLFSLLERKLKIYVKKHGSSPGVFDFAFGNRQESRVAPMHEPPSERKPEVSLQQLADRKILDKYGPPGVLVDENLNIMQFRGQTGPFLAPSPGAATLNLLRMVRPELLVSVKASVQRALTEGVQVSCDPVRLANSQKLITVDIMPVDASSCPRCLLVLFREEPSVEVEGPGTTFEGAEPSAADQKRIAELERELISTKDYLETIIQELATSNEELQSSNEELQSSNEELQSTNEELETSKEELQATNEELVTVNEELQTRITQLGIANDDIINVLMNITSPVLLVGLDLRIRRFSAAAERLLHLIASDVGRPISYLGTSLNVPQIEATVSESINTMRPREIRVRCSNGSWYAMHTAPYQTAERAIRGVVIELIPVDPPDVHRGVLELHELVAKVLSTIPDMVVLLDQNLRMVWSNNEFIHHCAGGADVLGLPLESLLPRSAELATLWHGIEQAVFTQHPFDNVVTQRRGEGAAATWRWSARCIPAESGRGALTMVVVSEGG